MGHRRYLTSEACAARSARSMAAAHRALVAVDLRANGDANAFESGNQPAGRLGVPKVAFHLNQFSTLSAGTRLNFATLSVTHTASMARACAAISMSCAPMGVPFFSSATRIAA